MKYLLLALILTMSIIYAQSVDEDKMNSCLCVCSCGEAYWDCTAVACYYNPGAVDASPNCMDTGLGACVCQGFGCGRAPITDKCRQQCMEQYGPKCGNEEVVVDGECVHIDKACVGENMRYNSDSQTCGCDPGYYYVNEECIEPNRERKTYYTGIKDDGKKEFRAEYGETITKTYTVKARDDAVGVSIFKIGRIWPSWLSKYVSIQPATLHLNPGETGTFTITINTNRDSFQADQYISYYIEGMDDKYSYVVSDSVKTYLNEPEVDDEYEDVVYDNSEVYNEENEVVPEMPTESSGDLFEDVKRVIRAGAFGTEAAAEMESLVDMFSNDPNGDKDLLTALAIIGLVPVDKLPNGMRVITSGTTYGEVTAQIAKEFLDVEKENAVKKMFDVTGTLTTDAKKEIFKNLSNLLPTLLQNKYVIESETSLYKKEMELQDKIMKMR